MPVCGHARARALHFLSPYAAAARHCHCVPSQWRSERLSWWQSCEKCLLPLSQVNGQNVGGSPVSLHYVPPARFDSRALQGCAVEEGVHDRCGRREG
jgi:hypothetical protein